MSDSPPLLSICIPTHNRAECLRELLESIASQIRDEVELIISDDACTDHTAEVVASFRSCLPRLRFLRSATPLRYDRNILKVVSAATGAFCWLFSDDDRMKKDALSCVLSALESDQNLTGITVGRTPCDHLLARSILVRPLRQESTMLFTSGEAALEKLLDRLGFLSCQIVNRELWNQVAESERLESYFGGYVQLYIILRMLTQAPRWLFLRDECVDFRSDNDSFRVLGSLGRLKMDVCGYETIIGDIFGRSSEIYHKSMSEVARTHARHHIVSTKRAGAPISYSLRAAFLCLRYYYRYPAFWLHTFPILLLPRAIALKLRAIHQSRRNKRGLTEKQNAGALQ